MKKILVAVLVVAVTLIGASVALAKIANSKHDLSLAGGQFTGGGHSSCAYCHTPHMARNIAPLWNRTDPVTTGYTLYKTVDGFTAGTPGNNSLTCLSCHDGSIGVGTTLQFTDTIAGTGLVGGVVTGSWKTGPDLSGVHPIGIQWNRPSNNAGLTSFLPSGTSNVTVGATAWMIYYRGGLWYVECGSCHDPHSDDYTANTIKSPFLKGSKSTICTDCHGTK